jgi:NAD(P)-dependent dehydrogenase (short-subunit alcohol dehydrogenase family)
MTELVNQVVLVTGCSTGIGRAVVRELKARGHRPFATARKVESVADLGADGIETLRLDVTEPGSIRAAVASVVERAGRVDVLVNNAGVNAFGPIAELPLEELRSVLETNVVGLVAAMQAVFPAMAARRAGRIINIGSVVGLLPTPFAAGYCASKAAVHSLSEVLRQEVKPFGIEVVVVQPGGVKSNIAESGGARIDRYRAEASRYRAYYEGIRKRAYASQDNPMPTEDFARELVAQSFANPAPRIVRLGTGADYLPKLAELPGEQRDGILASTYGLDAVPEAPKA